MTPSPPQKFSALPHSAQLEPLNEVTGFSCESLFSLGSIPRFSRSFNSFMVLSLFFVFPTFQNGVNVAPIALVRLHRRANRLNNPFRRKLLFGVFEVFGNQWCEHANIGLPQRKNVGTFGQ